MHTARSSPSILASYIDGCIHCSFLDDSASSCVVIASDKSQIHSNNGITSIEIFNIASEGDRAYHCIDKSISDFNFIVFPFDKIQSRISGIGVRIELDQIMTINTTTGDIN